mgnify:FL=1
MLNSKGNPVRFLNFINPYQTPYGYVVNGYTHTKYNEIYLRAKDTFEEKYYKTDFFDFIKTQKNHEDYVLSYVDFRTIWLTPQRQLWKNFYVLENLNDKTFDLPKSLLDQILQTKYFYFLFIDDNPIPDSILNEIGVIKNKNKINRDRFIHVSKNNIKTSGINLLKYDDFNTDDFLKKLDVFTDRIDKDFPTELYVPPIQKSLI